MANSPPPPRNPLSDDEPADGLVSETLSKRDLSLITVSCLVSLYRANELPFHLRLALAHNVTRDELVELITYLASFCGWPNAATALMIARCVFEKAGL